MESDGRCMEHVQLIGGDLVDTSNPIRHDSVKLAKAVVDVYHGKYRSGAYSAGASSK